jgi:hypothetical protein
MCGIAVAGAPNRYCAFFTTPRTPDGIGPSAIRLTVP